MKLYELAKKLAKFAWSIPTEKAELKDYFGDYASFESETMIYLSGMTSERKSGILAWLDYWKDCDTETAKEIEMGVIVL